MAACCPPGSLPFLETSYTPTGGVKELSPDVSVYVSGTPGPTAVVLIPDIYGWNGGRTRALADYWASKGNYAVVAKLLVPALEGGTDGDGFPATAPFSIDFMKTFTWEGSFKPKLEAIKAHLVASGVKKAHLVGFCFGGWPVFKTLADAELGDLIASGSVPHPSVQLDQYAFGGNVVDLVAAVSKPVLLLPAGNDSAEYDVGGAWCPKSAESIRFPDMSHGWVPRGDLEKEEVKRDVQRAVEAIDAFMARH